MEKPLHELKHEAIPGYKPAFMVIMTLFVIYLAIIILTAPDGGATHGHH